MINLGLLLGIKVGSALRNTLSTENDGLIIAHRIKGRRRYLSKALKNHPETCQIVQEALSQIEEVTYCKINPVTGSLTVAYTLPENKMDLILDSFSHALAGKHAQQESTILPSAVITVSDNINDTFRSARDSIRNFFNHTEPLFVSRLVGMGLLFYGVTLMINRGDRPAGPQLFWWGLGLLLRQSHKHNKEN